MAYHRTFKTYPNKQFKVLQVVLLITFFFHLCCANSSSQHHNHIHYQKQKTPKNSPQHHSHHSDRQRSRRNEERTFHRHNDVDAAGLNFDSIDRFYDLSHAYFDGMPVEEGGIPLEMSLMKQDGGEGARSEFYDFCMGEKLGTHINAPSTYQHYRNGSWSVDKIPVEFLVNVPTIIIDHPTFSATRHHGMMFDGNMKILNDGFFTNIESRAYTVSKIDLDTWEELHGRIPKGALVILRTGWSQYFNQPDNFFGNFADQDKQVFPGFGADAASWLLSERNIRGIGTECVDVELAGNTGNAVKQLIAERNRYSVVQLTNLENLPLKGIRTTIAPMKLLGGAGGPARVFAQVLKTQKTISNKHKHKPKNHHKHHQRKERHNDNIESKDTTFRENNGNNNSDDIYPSTHTTREIKSHLKEKEIINNEEVFSTASISSRSHIDDNAMVSMNRAYDSGGSSASSQKANFLILTILIVLYSTFL